MGNDVVIKKWTELLSGPHTKESRVEFQQLCVVETLPDREPKDQGEYQKVLVRGSENSGKYYSGYDYAYLCFCGSYPQRGDLVWLGITEEIALLSCGHGRYKRVPVDMVAEGRKTGDLYYPSTHTDRYVCLSLESEGPRESLPQLVWVVIHTRMKMGPPYCKSWWGFGPPSDEHRNPLWCVIHGHESHGPRGIELSLISRTDYCLAVVDKDHPLIYHVDGEEGEKTFRIP